MIRVSYHQSDTVIFLVSFFLTLTLTLSCTPKAATESITGEEVKLKTIDKGYYAGISGNEMSFYVINNKNDFSSLLKKIHSAEINPFESTVVDFSKNIVIAAVHGEKPTGGYSISIDKKAFLSNGRLTVKVIFKKPSPGQFLTQAFSNPYTIVSASIEKAQIREVYFTDSSGTILKSLPL